MQKRSAGILLFRIRNNDTEVLLAHPGGPFWRHRDAGAWSIPKGELDGDEATEAAARREFAEELGTPAPATLTPLGDVTQRGGKQVFAFAARGDFDVAALRSNTVELEWPARSGRMISFAEIDKVQWMTLAPAREKINPAQQPFLDRLVALERLWDRQ